MPLTLSAGDFIDGPAFVGTNQFGNAVGSEEARFFNASAKWLVYQGYISAAEPMLSNIRECVLTDRGFTVLNAMPESLKGESPLGAQIVSATKSGAKDVAGKLAQEAINFGVGWALRQF